VSAAWNQNGFVPSSVRLTLCSERRQLPGGGWLSAYLPKLKALKIEQLPSQLTVTGAKRVRITFGPYKLKGTKVSHEVVPPLEAEREFSPDQISMAINGLGVQFSHLFYIDSKTLWEFLLNGHWWYLICE
jgi:hypothetical protein